MMVTRPTAIVVIMVSEHEKLRKRENKKDRKNSTEQKNEKRKTNTNERNRFVYQQIKTGNIKKMQN